MTGCGHEDRRNLSVRCRARDCSTGTASVFVRVSGCNLRCWFCDTPYAQLAARGRRLGGGGDFGSVAAVEREHVVLTGGEPMLFAELIPLAAVLRAPDKHITIETAGTLYLPVECDLMSISPKLSNSTPVREGGRWRRRQRGAACARRGAAADWRVSTISSSSCRHAGRLRRSRAFLEEFPRDRSPRVHADAARDRRRGAGTQAEWLEPYCQRTTCGSARGNTSSGSGSCAGGEAGSLKSESWSLRPTRSRAWGETLECGGMRRSGDFGEKTSTVTAPAATRIRPA